MALRPVFLVPPAGEHCVLEADVEFEWVPGMAISQKQKCSRSLHDAIKRKYESARVLEVSSKSEDPLGLKLSAFNLVIRLDSGEQATVESAFQGSKVFYGGGPYSDLLLVHPREAKRDKRLKAAGPLAGFEFQGSHWGLTPRTAFYDWLYLRALIGGDLDRERILSFDAFTDIEFNPKKSVNCQARSVALYRALSEDPDVDVAELLGDQESFIRVHEMRIRHGDLEHGSLF